MRKKIIHTDTRKIIRDSLIDAFKTLTPSSQFKNPVMFVTYVGAILTTICTFDDLLNRTASWFNIQITIWLWFTVYFASFAEAVAESKGKAVATGLKKIKVKAFAKLIRDGVEYRIPSNELKKGDLIICETGDVIPADGDVVEGIATVDESAITGESAPVIRESGGDRCAVTAGTKILSDRITISVTSESGKSFLDKMINLIENARRQRTPNEIAIHIVITGPTILFLLVTCSLKMFSDYASSYSAGDIAHIITIPVLVSLLVCLIPTTIAALLSAVGIAGIDRLIRLNVIAKSGKCVEAAGDIDILLLDKTGTITIGNRMADDFIPVTGVGKQELATVAQLASLSDETPEGRSIVVLAKKLFDLRAESLDATNCNIIRFSAKTKMSGIDFIESGKVVRSIRKGASDSIKQHIESLGGVYPKEIDAVIHEIAVHGGTPLLVSDNAKVMGVIQLKDIVKGGIKKKFEDMRKMGIRTVMVTGDNALTAAAIAAESGVDDYIANATPEMKLDIIRKEQEKGHLVAMAGDGTNDAPALAQADVAVAMNTGTQASREAGNMMDLDSNPTKLLEIVEVGKQLLMTRGALTTFSISNDVAKYFAILPAIFGTLYTVNGEKCGPLSILNLMYLHSHHSAILSTVIFNALIIIALIPLALKGVSYKSEAADVRLNRNIMIYGVGGLVAPFIGIKIIDLLITGMGLI